VNAEDGLCVPVAGVHASTLCILSLGFCIDSAGFAVF